MSGTDELCMMYMPIAGRAELVRLIAAAGGLTLHESAELPAGESKSEYLSPSGTPLLKHGDLKLSQSGAIEAYLASIAPKFSGLTPQQRAIDGMYAGIKEEMLSNCAKALFTTKNGEDVTKLLDDRWFPLMEASIPAEGFINGLAFPTVADLAVLNITTGYSAHIPTALHFPTAPPPSLPLRRAIPSVGPQFTLSAHRRVVRSALWSCDEARWLRCHARQVPQGQGACRPNRRSTRTRSLSHQVHQRKPVQHAVIWWVGMDARVGQRYRV